MLRYKGLTSTEKLTTVYNKRVFPFEMKIDLNTAKRYMAGSSSHINKVCFVFKVFLSEAHVTLYRQPHRNYFCLPVRSAEAFLLIGCIAVLKKKYGQDGVEATATH